MDPLNVPENPPAVAQDEDSANNNNINEGEDEQQQQEEEDDDEEAKAERLILLFITVHECPYSINDPWHLTIPNECTCHPKSLTGLEPFDKEPTRCPSSKINSTTFSVLSWPCWNTTVTMLRSKGRFTCKAFGKSTALSIPTRQENAL